MNTRHLALRAVVLLAAFICCVALLALAILRDLAVELADEIRASRNEHRSREGNMSKENRRLTDSTSALRAANAKLAALVGDSTRARETLSDARQLAAELAIPMRRSA